MVVMLLKPLRWKRSVQALSVSGVTFTWMVSRRRSTASSVLCSLTTTSCVSSTPPGLSTRKYSATAISLLASGSMVSMASLMTTSKLLSGKGSSVALACCTCTRCSSPAARMFCRALFNAFSSKSTPVMWQPKRCASPTAVVPILQATSSTCVSGAKRVWLISHSVAKRPPGRRRVLPRRARK